MSDATLLTDLFHQLAGRWKLDRKLQSADDTEPSGQCDGFATLTPREPCVVMDGEGKLNTADAEMLYHEQGEFQIAAVALGHGGDPRFRFSRKYIWRLSKEFEGPSISIWFTKPGTETIDYLFHKVDMARDRAGRDEKREIQLHGTGGHLCVDDYYSSFYSFIFTANPESNTVLSSWSMTHEVRGPQKDQVIETTFTRG